MVQSRIYDASAILTQGRTKALASNLLAPGIYSGFEPTVVSTSLIRLSAGSLLLPSGILTIESADVDITDVPLVAGDYTLTADHDDIQAIGGSPVIYQFRDGILDPSGDPNASSLAVLWLRYTGGPITSAMISTPVVRQNGALLEELLAFEGFLQAPFAHLCDQVKGANIILTPAAHKGGAQHLGYRITNTASSGTQSLQFTLPLPPLPWVRRIEVYGDLPANSSISLRQTFMTLSGPATAGTAVAIDVNSTAGFAANDKFTIRDPSTGTQEIISIIAIVSGTQFTATIANSYTTGSTVKSLSQVHDATGAPVLCSPAVVNGPLTGLTTPLVTFVVGNSTTQPATLGINISTQPTSTGVFLKGFRLLGD